MSSEHAAAAGGGAAAAPAGQPAPDPVAIIRSRPYLLALVLAAVLGAPISAVAYGFLALVDADPAVRVRRPAPGRLHRGRPSVVAGAVVGALRTA